MLLSLVESKYYATQPLGLSHDIELVKERLAEKTVDNDYTTLLRTLHQVRVIVADIDGMRMPQCRVLKVQIRRCTQVTRTRFGKWISNK